MLAAMTLPRTLVQRRKGQAAVDFMQASFGTLLKRFRQAVGLSQEALAERARMSVRGISDLERGDHRAPYRETLRQLMYALELDGEQQAALETASRAAQGPRGDSPVLPAAVVADRRDAPGGAGGPAVVRRRPWA